MLEIQSKQNYILVNFIGAFSIEAAKKTVDTIIGTCAAEDQSAVVLDCSSMTGKLSVIDRYRTIVYGQKMIGKVSKFALVADIKMVLPDHFAETVAVNRGINLKVFTDAQQAVHWVND